MHNLIKGQLLPDCLWLYFLISQKVKKVNKGLKHFWKCVVGNIVNNVGIILNRFWSGKILVWRVYEDQDGKLVLVVFDCHICNLNFESISTELIWINSILKKWYIIISFYLVSFIYPLFILFAQGSCTTVKVWSKRMEQCFPESKILPSKFPFYLTIDVKNIWNNSYIWTAVVDQSEEWSSQ